MVSDSIPSKPRFTAETVDGHPVRGKVEVIRGLFGSTTETHELASENVVTKGFLDANYSIYVTPETETNITFETRHFRASALMWVLAIVVVIGVIASLSVVLFNNTPPTAGQ